MIMDEEEIHPQVKKLLALPQYEQLSPEWFEQRTKVLTASLIDTVLGRSKYQTAEEVLFAKCGIKRPFLSNDATRHGQKYEDEAIAHYCERYNKKNISFGLLPHPTIPFLAGSPDDITYDGIVIEVKCPLRRKIVMGEIPHHYLSQILFNMEICNLDKGVFIEYRPAWMNDNDEITLNVIHLDRDREWFKRVYPKLESFWKDVCFYRDVGISYHPQFEYWNHKYGEKKSIDIGPPRKKTCLFVEEEDDSD